MVSVGIQILLSTYVLGQGLPNFAFSGASILGKTQNSKYSKCQDLPKFAFSWGGVEGAGEQGWVNWGPNPRIGQTGIFEPLQLATASQIVSHILRMWRLKISVIS